MKITIFKGQNSKFLTTIFIVVVFFLCHNTFCFSQSHDLDKLKDEYFKENKYSEFISFLKNLREKDKTFEGNAGFYIALSRYQQLKTLEEKQEWQEYFDFENQYRKEIFIETEKVILLMPYDKVALDSAYLNWLMHKEENDNLKDSALEKLLNLVDAFALKSTESAPIRDIADNLSHQKENIASQRLYNLYVDKLNKMKKSYEELRDAADVALKKDNLYLARMLYELYIKDIEDYPPDKLIDILASVAEKFGSSGWSEGKDPEFAERIYQKIKEAAGEETLLSDSLQYARAYNLERQKDYQRASEEYRVLIENYLQSGYLEESYFKLGLFYTYILKRQEEAKIFFDKIIDGNFASLAYRLASLYQKALYHQFNANREQALSNYQKILELAKQNNYEDTLLVNTNQRLREINENKPIDYNLKLFLDATLGQQSQIETGLNSADIALYGTPAKISPSKTVQFSVKYSFSQQTGCLTPTLSFFWSGDLPNLKDIASSTEELEVSYNTAGPKVVNIVVVGPSGPVGIDIEIEGVYNVD